MNALIVLAHPEPRSYNSALSAVAERALRAQRHTVRVSDLYAKRFDPSEHARHYPRRKDSRRFSAQSEQRFSAINNILPREVGREIDLLLWADFVLFQFPLWWFGMPAMLKGWMDRVFAYGALYTSSHRYETGLLRGKRAMLSVTAGSSESACCYNGREGDTSLILWPIHYALHYVGFTVLEPLLITGVRAHDATVESGAPNEDLAARVLTLTERLATLDLIPTIRFNGSDDWDHQQKLKPGAPIYSPFIRHAANLRLDANQ